MQSIPSEKQTWELLGNQWLGLHSLTAKDLGSIHGQGARSAIHAMWPKMKKEKKKKEEEERKANKRNFVFYIN